MSENVSVGKRRRVYHRKFDWAEARARYRAGESMNSIARSYNVNPSAVQRVIRLPEHAVAVATEEQVNRLSEMRLDQVPCPRCSRPKFHRSALCRMCADDLRFVAEVRLEKEPGQARVVLADVEPGRIVRVGNRWGVLTLGARRQGQLMVDFWDGGPELVPNITVVATAPRTRVFVGGVEEEPEEIAA